VAGRQAVVALTDERWFSFLSSRAVGARLDEVNFWRPLAQTEFHALEPGGPFFFRLKHPVNSVVGFGFFATATRLPVALAWDAFREGNGDPTREGFVGRIAEYRRETPAEVILGHREVTCIILRDVQLLPESSWLRWGTDEEWRRNIVAFKSYDLDAGAGRLLANLLHDGVPADLAPAYQPVTEDDRRQLERAVTVREGQGVFRIRILDAYDRRCAVTGEHSLPVLDSAHIQPYLGPASNHVQNGLSLRADIHRLFDAGYVTVTPDYRFQVSRRLQEEYENGRVYYELNGAPLAVLPHRPENRPSRAALEWHASEVFR